MTIINKIVTTICGIRQEIFKPCCSVPHLDIEVMIDKGGFVTITAECTVCNKIQATEV